MVVIEDSEVRRKGRTLNQMIPLDGLLSLKDMGGRRRGTDRRRAASEFRVLERRTRKDRRSGFDRRGILKCTVRGRFDRRKAFRSLAV